MTDNRDIVAVYTPLVTLVTYDKTGSTPDVPEEAQVPYLSTPELAPAVMPSDKEYGKAWFMTYEGEMYSDTPFEQPCLEDMELDPNEYSYMWYTELPFTLRLDEETSYTNTYTLCCAKSTIDEEFIIYRYFLCIPFSPEEPGISPENLVFDNAFLTIVFEDSEEAYYEIILDEFNYSVASENELLSFSDLTSMLEDSNDESGPVLITGAIAELRVSDVE